MRSCEPRTDRWTLSQQRDSARKSSSLATVVGGVGPYTCRRSIRRLRCQASPIRHGSAAQPATGSRGSCAGSAPESRRRFVDGHRLGGTSSAAETAPVPTDYGLRLNDDERVQQRRYSRYSHTNSNLSMFLSVMRPGDFRRKTTSCWRRRRFSASSRAGRENCERMTCSSWTRNVAIGRFITMRPSARHLGYGFRDVLPCRARL